MPNISILGSTGSIGRQALDVINSLGNDYKVAALTGHTNYKLLAEQAKRYRPEMLVLTDENKTDLLKKETAGSGIRIECGEEALLEAATLPAADIILMAVVGFSGFRPTVAALKAGKRVALANKESLVVGGELLSREVPGFRDFIIPVDSEHSAVYQCLAGESPDSIRRIILTASGGPFRGWSPHQLKKATPEKALKHPNWQMGAKITVDSATLMNKGFEVLEASWLFDVNLDKIEVLVHPQSIVHSFVEYDDGAVMAQLASPDMRLPIQYAFTFPVRRHSSFPRVDFLKQNLEFERPDTGTFPCLDYAYRAGKDGGTMPACMNAANEVAVDLFIKGKISFPEIAGMIKKIMDIHNIVKNPSEKDILDAHRWASEKAGDIY